VQKINLPILALILANAIWGAASPVFKYALQNIPPFSLAFLRFLLASLLLYPLIHKRLQYADLKNKWLWAFAVCSVPVNITFFFLALQRTVSINAPIIASAGPVFVLLASAIFLREEIRPAAVVGTVLSLAGILVIIGQPLLDRGFGTEIIGNILLVLATLGATGQIIIGRKILTPANTLPFTFWTFLIGTLWFLPFFLYEYGQNPAALANLDARGGTGIAFGAFLSSFAAYTMYNWAISRLPAFRVSVFAYLDPVVAILIAIPLLGEKITPPFILGSVLVFLGILIAERRFPWHPIHELKVKN
jgi:drug/metabolite transporter (DMT)-like permease